MKEIRFASDVGKTIGKIQLEESYASELACALNAGLSFRLGAVLLRNSSGFEVQEFLILPEPVPPVSSNSLHDVLSRDSRTTMVEG